LLQHAISSLSAPLPLLHIVVVAVAVVWPLRARVRRKRPFRELSTLCKKETGLDKPKWVLRFHEKAERQGLVATAFGRSCCNIPFPRTFFLSITTSSLNGCDRRHWRRVTAAIEVGTGGAVHMHRLRLPRTAVVLLHHRGASKLAVVFRYSPAPPPRTSPLVPTTRTKHDREWQTHASPLLIAR
jgi:hypothetical protein